MLLITFLSQLSTLNWCFLLSCSVLLGDQAGISFCMLQHSYQQAFVNQLQDLIPYVWVHAMSDLLWGWDMVAMYILRDSHNKQIECSRCTCYVRYSLVMAGEPAKITWIILVVGWECAMFQHSQQWQCWLVWLVPALQKLYPDDRSWWKGQEERYEWWWFATRVYWVWSWSQFGIFC